MTGPLSNRWIFSLFGAASGFALWQLLSNVEGDMSPMGQRLTLFSLCALAVFTGGFFAMAGRLSAKSTVMRALLLALLVAGLAVLVSLRWEAPSDMLETPTHFLALCAVTVLPVPFLITSGQGSWRNYPALFDISWEIVSRGIVAIFFTAVVWMVIGLAAMLFNMVGITVIEDLILRDGMPLVISGAAFGLAVAVVKELSDMLSPTLIHWLLRLLLPLVTLISLVFVGAVILRGFDGGLRGLSPALVLLSIAAAGITLVTVTLDSNDEEASKSPVILWSARLMVVVLPVLAGLSLRAVWIRISDQGLTPNRLFVLVLGVIALAYGLTYAAALLRRGGFARAVRAANLWLSLVVIGSALIWLTPLINAEAISARDQEARVMDGRKPVSQVDTRLFAGLGRAGDAARTRLEDYARSSGNTELLERLENGWNTTPAYDSDEETAARLAELRSALKTRLKVMPESAVGTRDSFLDSMLVWELEPILTACEAAGSQSGAGTEGGGCLMVVADLIPAAPGEEAVVMLVDSGGWATGYGLRFDETGSPATRDLRRADGRMITQEDLKAMFAAWSLAPPSVAPAKLNQIGDGDSGVLLLP